LVRPPDRVSGAKLILSRARLRVHIVFVPVSVDIDSAVVSYRPAVDEQRSVLAKHVAPEALYATAPWRTFRWYFGQRHYSGTYWSATQHDHVIYESRLELSALLLADFDRAVRGIAAQPFQLTSEVNGKSRRHVLDYLWDTVDGPVVVDVVRRERLSQPKIQFLCSWTRRIVESLGWSYEVVSEPARVRLANVRFLAGYRREWLINQPALEELRFCAADLIGARIEDAERRTGKRPQALVRSALLHMMWAQEFTANLDHPLNLSTVLEAPP
jgi:hypothetical protein